MNQRKSVIVSCSIVVFIVAIFFVFIVPWVNKKGPDIDKKLLDITGVAAEKPYEIRVLGPDCIGVIARPVHKSNIGSGMDIYDPTMSFFLAIEELQKQYRIKYPPTPIVGGSVSGSSTAAILLVVEKKEQ